MLLQKHQEAHTHTLHTSGCTQFQHILPLVFPFEVTCQMLERMAQGRPQQTE